MKNKEEEIEGVWFWIKFGLLLIFLITAIFFTGYFWRDAQSKDEPTPKVYNNEELTEKVNYIEWEIGGNYYYLSNMKNTLRSFCNRIDKLESKFSTTTQNSRNCGL